MYLLTFQKGLQFGTSQNRIDTNNLGLSSNYLELKEINNFLFNQIIENVSNSFFGSQSNTGKRVIF
jgi:hypothetical protein